MPHIQKIVLLVVLVCFVYIVDGERVIVVFSAMSLVEVARSFTCTSSRVPPSTSIE
jgi:hypothetical protein